MTLAIIEPDQEVQALLTTPLTSTEQQELEACELQIELAGKDRLEKALLIGEKLSTIYNRALFRGEGGRTWLDWVEQRLPEILPEAGGKNWADDRRVLFEVRSLLSRIHSDAGLPAGTTIGRGLKALIPRRFSHINANWNPSELDQPADGLSAVWELAQRLAVKQQRKSGPTEKDVADAREELRPQLLEQGLIREAPKAFQQSTADRMEAAAARRQQVVDVVPEDEIDDYCIREMIEYAREGAPERRKAAEVEAVKQEIGRAERERQEENIELMREYNSKLIQAHKGVDELHTFMRKLRNIQGTSRLAELRETEYLMMSVADDLERLTNTARLFMELGQWARTLDEPQGVDMTTIDLAA